MDTNHIATIIIRNAQGQFYAHQRSAEKRTFPGLYGLGAGGHIQDGESPTEAAKRELFEEAGVDAEPTLLFSFPFSTGDMSYDLHVHEVQVDGEIEADKHEWQWSGWLDKDEIDELIAQGKLMPDTTIFYRRYIDGVHSA